MRSILSHSGKIRKAVPGMAAIMIVLSMIFLGNPEKPDPGYRSTEQKDIVIDHIDGEYTVTMNTDTGLSESNVQGLLYEVTGEVISPENITVIDNGSN